MRQERGGAKRRETSPLHIRAVPRSAEPARHAHRWLSAQRPTLEIDGALPLGKAPPETHPMRSMPATSRRPAATRRVGNATAALAPRGLMPGPRAEPGAVPGWAGRASCRLAGLGRSWRMDPMPPGRPWSAAAARPVRDPGRSQAARFHRCRRVTVSPPPAARGSLTIAPTGGERRSGARWYISNPMIDAPRMPPTASR
jgi:hypothetical protein